MNQASFIYQDNSETVDSPDGIIIRFCVSSLVQIKHNKRPIALVMHDGNKNDLPLGIHDGVQIKEKSIEMIIALICAFTGMSYKKTQGARSTKFQLFEKASEE